MGKRSKGIIPFQKGAFNGETMKKLLALVLLCLVSAGTISAADQNLSKVYRDYTWDVGAVGGLGFEGMHTDTRRVTLGMGIRGGYHLTDTVGLSLEYINFFNSFQADNNVEETKSQLFIGSITYDFSSERSYSLYAIASLGYEQLDKLGTTYNNPIGLAGFGFRYLFTDDWSVNIEGRLRMRLKDISSDTGDFGLVGTIGVNYHFGLSEE